MRRFPHVINLATRPVCLVGEGDEDTPRDDWAAAATTAQVQEIERTAQALTRRLNRVETVVKELSTTGAKHITRVGARRGERVTPRGFAQLARSHADTILR